MGLNVKRQVSAALPLERNLVPIVQEAGWTQGQVWTGAENPAHPGMVIQVFTNIIE
jgi:hypothetical protein